MESLLDNPMKAVLYLKELTTIVQNQQSLIQTQRQRIDELERKVEELIGENRQLKDPHQAHHYHHHHHPSPPSTSPQPPVLPHQHPANKTATLPGHPPQQVQNLPTQPQQPPPPPPTHQPQQLQLVPTSSQSPQPGKSSPESAEEDKKSASCKSLVPQAPTTLCRSVGLARKAEMIRSIPSTRNLRCYIKHKLNSVGVSGQEGCGEQL
ncbi:hypothetical protein SKAU_G00022320 [Synaphobranchus kaupii]|uniref:IQ motif and SEC7 domain-containing protein 3 n=1 Tax=Synaphobranchus kaupii TaxID=118154 RepID=A0A9Q1GC38_SYNKA|nr:hypothetical protein SKAU_G00022320 [Synaphobranchus kaupii]